MNKIIVFFIIIIFIIFLFLYFFKNKMLFFYKCSGLIFGNSCRIDLTNFKTMNEYLKSLSSKRRNDLKHGLNQNKKYKIITGKFKMSYIKNLYNFMIKKYNNKFKIYYHLYLATSVLLFTNQLKFFEYYNEKNEFIGWSSYFIDNGIYYDFLTAPKKGSLFITNIILHSLNYCFKNKIKKIDLGQSHQKLKKRKFNAYNYPSKLLPFKITFSITIT